MTKSHSPNRRRVVAGLLSTPFLAGCAGQNMPSGAVASRRSSKSVALLLPLSGLRAALGQQMAKTVWLTEDLLGKGGKTEIVDAGESPASAAAAARKALSGGADVLVGPLFRNQTPAVVAEANGVPVLTMSNDTRLADQGAWVFGVTPAQSVETVIRYASDTNANRITMLESKSPLGARAQAALASRARSSGITALPVVSGDTPAGMMPDALLAAGGASMPDMIYIPTSGPAEINQAVAAVKAGVTTIGSLQWAGLPGDQLMRLNKACFTGPDPDRFNRLSAQVQQHLEEDMGVIAALAVDAVAAAQTLGTNTPIDGLLGGTRFRADRTCARDLAVLRIDGTSVQRVA